MNIRRDFLEILGTQTNVDEGQQKYTAGKLVIMRKCKNEGNMHRAKRKLVTPTEGKLINPNVIDTLVITVERNKKIRKWTHIAS